MGSLSGPATAFGAQFERVGAAVVARTRAWYNPDLKSLLSMAPGLLAIVLTLPALALTLAVTREKEVGHAGGADRVPGAWAGNICWASWPPTS